MAAVHLSISGRVQGVWYRGWTVEQATRLGLDGWVRNRRDGSVEAVVSGERAKIEDLISLCHRGPRLARVDEIVQSEYHGEALDPGFFQRPTD